jgi:hypothetical protein
LVIYRHNYRRYHNLAYGEALAGPYASPLRLLIRALFGILLGLEYVKIGLHLTTVFGATLFTHLELNKYNDLLGTIEYNHTATYDFTLDFDVKVCSTCMQSLHTRRSNQHLLGQPGTFLAIALYRSYCRCNLSSSAAFVALSFKQKAELLPRQQTE